MKKNMFIPIMGLLACVAFSPPAFSAPDTGPKVDNIEVKDISASANLIMPEQGVFEIGITDNYFSTYVQVSGQETVVPRSDHSVVITDYTLENSCLDSKNKLVSSDKYGLVAWFERRSCSDLMDDNSWKCNTLNASKNKKSNVIIGAASMAALYPGQMVWVHKRPAWPIRPARL